MIADQKAKPLNQRVAFLFFGVIVAMTIGQLLSSPARAQSLSVDGLYRAGTGEMLRNFKPEDIADMNILRMKKDGGKVQIGAQKDGTLALRGVVQEYVRHEFDRATISGILTLFKAAPKSVPQKELVGVESGIPVPDCLMVVKPVKGNAFAIPFFSHFARPFEGVWSRQLKEALYGAVHWSSISIILYQDGGVTDTKNPLPVPAFGPGRWNGEWWDSGPLSQGVTTLYRQSLQLDKKGQILLNLKLLKGGQRATEFDEREREGVPAMDETRPVRYGQATVFQHPQLGPFIVLLQNPTGF